MKHFRTFGSIVDIAQRKVPPEKVVLVTGSSGFLGQHIVKQLQEQDDCDEIRLFDIVRYRNSLNHSMAKRMYEFLGDITNEKHLLEAFDGVGCVIHCAGCVDVSLHANAARLRSVNVDGTRNVVDACRKSNVRALVFTSTADTILSTSHGISAYEQQPQPSKLLFEAYAKSKLEAERIVLAANTTRSSGSARSTSSEHELRTCVLRPTILYGEEDRHFVTVLMKMAKNYGFNVLPRVRSVDECLQMTYVGNAAKAHLDAKMHLLSGGVGSSGIGDGGGGGGGPLSEPVYYITDDTPLEQLFDAVKPFVEAQDVRISNVTIPWIVAIIVIGLICRVLSLSQDVFPVEKYFPTPAMINYACSTILVDRRRATHDLKYYPIYSYEESKKRSLGFYKRVRIRI